MADEEKKTSAKPEKKSDKKAAKPAKKADGKADKSKKSKKNPFKSIATFFKSVRAEGKKVVWSPAKDVLKNTLTVIVVVVIAGVCIYGVDTLLSLGMKGVKNLADKSETTSVSDTTTQETTAEALDSATTQAAE